MGAKGSKQISKSNSSSKQQRVVKQEPLNVVNESLLNSTNSENEIVEIRNQHDEKLQNELKVIDPNDLPKVPSLPNVPPPNQNDQFEEQEQMEKEDVINSTIEIEKIEENKPIIEEIQDKKEEPIIIEQVQSNDEKKMEEVESLPKTPELPIGASPTISSNEIEPNPIEEEKAQPPQIEHDIIIELPKLLEELPMIEKGPEIIFEQPQQISEEVPNNNEAENKLINLFNNGQEVSEKPSHPQRPRPTRKATIGKKLYSTFTRKKSQRIQKDGETNDMEPMSIPHLKHSDTVGEINKPISMETETDQQHDYKANRPQKANKNNTKYNTISMKFNTFKKKLFNEEEIKQLAENENTNNNNDSGSESDDEINESKKKKKFFNFEMSTLNSNMQKIGQVFLFAPGTMIYAGPM